MSHQDSSAINCIILRFGRFYYLLPESAVYDYYIYNALKIKTEGGSEHPVALLAEQSCHFVSLAQEKLSADDLHSKTKVAIIHQHRDQSRFMVVSPYEGAPHKLKIRPGDVSWIDVSKRHARLGSITESALEVIIPELVS